jgi:hypothetical protein
MSPIPSIGPLGNVNERAFDVRFQGLNGLGPRETVFLHAICAG